MSKGHTKFKESIIEELKKKSISDEAKYSIPLENIFDQLEKREENKIPGEHQNLLKTIRNIQNRNEKHIEDLLHILEHKMENEMNK